MFFHSTSQGMQVSKNKDKNIVNSISDRTSFSDNHDLRIAHTTHRLDVTPNISSSISEQLLHLSEVDYQINNNFNQLNTPQIIFNSVTDQLENGRQVDSNKFDLNSPPVSRDTLDLEFDFDLLDPDSKKLNNLTDLDNSDAIRLLQECDFDIIDVINTDSEESASNLRSNSCSELPTVTNTPVEPFSLAQTELPPLRTLRSFTSSTTTSISSSGTYDDDYFENRFQPIKDNNSETNFWENPDLRFPPIIFRRTASTSSLPELANPQSQSSLFTTICTAATTQPTRSRSSIYPTPPIATSTLPQALSSTSNIFQTDLINNSPPDLFEEEDYIFQNPSVYQRRNSEPLSISTSLSREQTIGNGKLPPAYVVHAALHAAPAKTVNEMLEYAEKDLKQPPNRRPSKEVINRYLKKQADIQFYMHNRKRHYYFLTKKLDAISYYILKQEGNGDPSNLMTTFDISKEELFVNLKSDTQITYNEELKRFYPDNRLMSSIHKHLHVRKKLPSDILRRAVDDALRKLWKEKHLNLWDEKFLTDSSGIAQGVSQHQIFHKIPKPANDTITFTSHTIYIHLQRRVEEHKQLACLHFRQNNNQKMCCYYLTEKGLAEIINNYTSNAINTFSATSSGVAATAEA